MSTTMTPASGSMLVGTALCENDCMVMALGEKAKA